VDQHWISVLLADPCAYCDAPSTALEHIDPLARGGEHTIDNVAGACLICNSSKKDDTLLTFLLRRAVRATG